MSESTTDTAGLTHQYSTQVAADFETNLKAQERLSGDIAALQEQLAALQHDHSVLVNIQQALGVTQTTKEPTPSTETATVPSPGRRPSPHRAASKPHGSPPPRRKARRPRSPPPRRNARRPRSPPPSPRRRRPSPLWWGSSAATSASRTNRVPLRKSPPRSARPIPSATSRPRSYASPSRGLSQGARPSAPSRVPPSSTPHRRRRPHHRPRRRARTPTAEPAGAGRPVRAVSPYRARVDPTPRVLRSGRGRPGGEGFRDPVQPARVAAGRHGHTAPRSLFVNCGPQDAPRPRPQCSGSAPMRTNATVTGSPLRLRQACRVPFWITMSPAESRVQFPSSSSRTISPPSTMP